MSFWPAYFKHSFGAPWVMRTQNEVQPQSGEGLSQAPVVSDEPETEYVFISAPLATSDLQTMMEKMVAAIKLRPDQVSFYFTEDESLSFLQYWAGTKKVMAFGSEYSPALGKLMDWFHHQVIVTHSLQTLRSKPESKKSTWEHLKNFARLS